MDRNTIKYYCSVFKKYKYKNNYLLLLKYEMLHSGRDPEAGTQFPVASQTDIGLPDMT